MAQPQVEIIDCASDSQTSYTVTIPDDAWMTQIVVDGVVLSGADVPTMILDAVTANYRRSYHVNSADDVDVQNEVRISSLSGVTHSGHYTIVGAKLAVPTYIRGCHIDVGDITVQHDTFMQTALTAHSTITIDTIGGAVTFDSGFIYLIHYIRNHEIIETVDFSAVTENSHVFAVGKHSSVVLACPGLLFGSADEPRLRVGTSATTDEGASDYEKGHQNVGSNGVETTTNLFSSRRVATTNDVIVHMEGFNHINAITCVINGASMADASTAPAHTAALRASAQKNTHLELFSDGGENFTGGIAYLIGAK